MKQVVIVILLLGLFNPASAHPISFSWANVTIDEGKLSVSYKIFVEDLIYYHNPPHDDNYDYEVEVLRTLSKKHGQVIIDHFGIELNNKRKLKATLIAINDGSLTSDKINVMNLMKHEIHYRFEFPFDTKTWEKLTFHQQLAQHEAGIPSITFLSVYENNVALVEDRELTLQQPITLIKGIKLSNAKIKCVCAL
jgi:hypothetical protein